MPFVVASMEILCPAPPFTIVVVDVDDPDDDGPPPPPAPLAPPPPFICLDAIFNR